TFPQINPAPRLNLGGMPHCREYDAGRKTSRCLVFPSQFPILGGICRLHGKLDLTKAKGLKKSEIQKLNKLLQQRIPEDRILTLDLAESIAEISYEIGCAISAVANRRGQIVNVTVGPPRDVNVPEMKGLRVGPGRLSGHRLIYSHLASKNGNGKAAGPNKEDLQCLAKNRLDLIALIDVDPAGKFSRSRGEQGLKADAVHIAHLMPSRDGEGKLWKLLEPCTARKAQ